MSTEFVIEIHNLKMENDKILRDDIQKVFQKKFTIDIAVGELEIEDCGDTKTATLYLQSISDALNIADSINNEGFKFTQIAKEYKKIYANRVHNKRPLNVYLNDENIGDETRQREFKEGSIDNFLRTANTKSLAHYACGFVNIQKDGTIFIGVDDHGKVKGVKFDHEKRDNIRTQISRIMKCDIEPPLSTVHYSISFAPVRTIKGEDQELQKKITKLIAEKDEKENEISSLEQYRVIRLANVYLPDENIGDETRFREFKVGGGYIDNFLKTGNLKFLALYACGFVNNQEAGIIYVGVNDHEDMYVLEIKFYTVDKFDKLYRVDGKVYEKRDACLSQPLSHKRILDWEEQIRHKQKNDELREQITNYEIDKAKNQQLIDEKDQEINKEKCLRLEKETTVTTLEREKSELIKENKKLMGKSKVCVIL
ncbi:unnamed protein product [Mytilus edulis]|uniref:Schlafen AlbA-2 domain-containing protein n=1 Tax=Mytilus edulis TaxID=6550 RepID=A0A8S3RXG4_MYTED|nr:unnamed protein product [Mytilus edulis]